MNIHGILTGKGLIKMNWSTSACISVVFLCITSWFIAKYDVSDSARIAIAKEDTRKDSISAVLKYKSDSMENAISSSKLCLKANNSDTKCYGTYLEYISKMCEEYASRGDFDNCMMQLRSLDQAHINLLLTRVH